MNSKFVPASAGTEAGIFVSGGGSERSENGSPRIFPVLGRVFAFRSAANCMLAKSADSEKALFSMGVNGAARGNRTHDLSLTKGVLYH